MFKIALALFAVFFVLVSDALAVCPIALLPPLRTRVTVVHRYVAAVPVVSVPIAEAPAAEIVAPAPVVRVYRQPMAAVVSVGVSTAAQRRHANKAARETIKAAHHAAKAAYWASRS